MTLQVSSCLHDSTSSNQKTARLTDQRGLTHISAALCFGSNNLSASTCILMLSLTLCRWCQRGGISTGTKGRSKRRTKGGKKKKTNGDRRFLSLLTAKAGAAAHSHAAAAAAAAAHSQAAGSTVHDHAAAAHAAAHAAAAIATASIATATADIATAGAIAHASPTAASCSW